MTKSEISFVAANGGNMLNMCGEGSVLAHPIAYVNQQATFFEWEPF